MKTYSDIQQVDACNDVEAEAEKIESSLAAKLIAGSIVIPPAGAIINGVDGVIGRSTLSFFNSSFASSAASFGTFAAIGAIALPLNVLATSLKNHCFDKSAFLKSHPILKESISVASDVLTLCGSILAASAIMGFPPLSATTISLLVLPLAVKAFALLIDGVNKLYNAMTKEAGYQITKDTAYSGYESLGYDDLEGCESASYNDVTDDIELQTACYTA